MQRQIRVERLPKLDKVLRVTFSTIKRDISQTREEFDQLEEKVNDSLEFYSKRLKETSDSTWIRVNKKAKEVEDKSSKKTKALEKELRLLKKRIDDFLTETNKKVTVWNKKIQRTDENAAKAKEIGDELKELQFLRSELEKVKVLDTEIKSIDLLKVDKKRFEKVKTDVYKRINDEAGSFATSLALSEKSTKNEVLNAKKEMQKRADGLDTKFDQMKATVTAALTQLDNRINDTKDTDKITEELVSIKVEILKEFNTMKSQYKEEMKSKQEKFNMRELKQEIIAEVRRGLGKNVPRTQKVQKAIPKGTKKHVIVERKGFLTKFIDFLVEDADDKDKMLQEFDRKKGGKFEIKEIKNLKE